MNGTLGRLQDVAGVASPRRVIRLMRDCTALRWPAEEWFPEVLPALHRNLPNFHEGVYLEMYCGRNPKAMAGYDSGSFRITVSLASGETAEIDVLPGCRVSDLKERLRRQWPSYKDFLK
eukprot:symbB.v1.2.030896.t1/scaffold3528.1/size54678/2